MYILPGIFFSRPTVPIEMLPLLICSVIAELVVDDSCKICSRWNGSSVSVGLTSVERGSVQTQMATKATAITIGALRVHHQ
jgi:hypothetical protein